jgi:hypothetical protein
METDYPARVRPPPFDFVEEWGTQIKEETREVLPNLAGPFRLPNPFE